MQRRRWNFRKADWTGYTLITECSIPLFRKADWTGYTLATECSIPLIPVNKISNEESYWRFCGAVQKAARRFTPPRFSPDIHSLSRQAVSCPTEAVRGIW